jgi:hypothetical protein
VARFPEIKVIEQTDRWSYRLLSEHEVKPPAPSELQTPGPSHVATASRFSGQANCESENPRWNVPKPKV